MAMASQCGESVVVGISIGCENCCVAVSAVPPPLQPSLPSSSLRSAAFDASLVGEPVAPTVVANEDGDRLRPIYAAIVEEDQIFGSAAKNERIRNPQRTLHCMAPLLHCPVGDDDAFGNYSQYNSLPTADTTTTAENDHPSSSPNGPRVVDVFGKFLSTVKAHCDTATAGRSVLHVAFSVPRHVNEHLLHRAIKAAGFTTATTSCIRSDCAAVHAHTRLCSEMLPTVDAPPSSILVLDWGTSTLAASLFTIHLGAFSLAAYEKNVSIGGAAMDSAIAESLWVNFQRKNRSCVPAGPLEGRQRRKLCAAVEQAKLALGGGAAQTAIDVEALSNGVDLREMLSRGKVEQFIRECGFVTQCEALIDEIIMQHCGVADGTSVHPLRHVVFAGGCFKMPWLRAAALARAAQAANCQPAALSVANVAEDELCAVGAAAHALDLSQCGKVTRKCIGSSAAVDAPTLSFDLCALTASGGEQSQQPPKLTDADAARAIIAAKELTVILPKGTVLPATIVLGIAPRCVSTTTTVGLALATVGPGSHAGWCTRTVPLDPGVLNVGISVDEDGGLHIAAETSTARGTFEPIAHF